LSPPPQPTANTISRAPPNTVSAVRGVEFIGEPPSIGYQLIPRHAESKPNDALTWSAVHRSRPAEDR
jgi:hypothetical protein